MANSLLNQIAIMDGHLHCDFERGITYYTRESLHKLNLFRNPSFPFFFLLLLAFYLIIYWYNVFHFVLFDIIICFNFHLGHFPESGRITVKTYSRGWAVHNK